MNARKVNSKGCSFLDLFILRSASHDEESSVTYYSLFAMAQILAKSSTETILRVTKAFARCESIY